MVYIIENDILSVSIDSFGACLDSIIYKSTGEQLLWQGDKKSWTGKDILIFPMIGRLNQKYYTYRGKEYNIEIHGIACYSDFMLIDKQPNKLIFMLHSNETTLQQYPFEFKLIAEYSLCDNRLKTFFKVINLSNNEMPFMIGSHPAYTLDNNTLDKNILDNNYDTLYNYIEFENTQYLSRYIMDNSNVFIKALSKPIYCDKIIIDKTIFNNDAIILKNVQGNITLVRKNGRKIKFYLNSPPNLAFWSHKYFGNFIAIEQWWGLPDENPPKREFENKLDVQILKSNIEFTYSYITEFC